MSLAADHDIHEPGRRAFALVREAFQGRGFFLAARRLRLRLSADGSWTGPDGAPWAWVEADALPALGGHEIAKRAGANAVVVDMTASDVEGDLGKTLEHAMACFLRFPFGSGESAEERNSHLEELRKLSGRYPDLAGILPTPTGVAQGLDTLTVFASCRLALPSIHLVADLNLLGHKLGQLCLSFGADSLVGAISDQRALRLGAAASSHDLTRAEAEALLRASGLEPCERRPEGSQRAP